MKQPLHHRSELSWKAWQIASAQAPNDLEWGFARTKNRNTNEDFV
jgi:hypothetical protein